MSNKQSFFEVIIGSFDTPKFDFEIHTNVSVSTVAE